MSETAVALPAFLDHPDRPPGTLTYPELQGFLFAVANAPEVIAPSEWIAEVFGGEAAFDNEAEERSIYAALVHEYLAVNDASLKGEMPPGCVLRDDPLANLEEEAPIREWARGFARGYGWLEETWQGYLPDDESDDEREQEIEAEFGSSVMILSFFASPEYAEAVVRESVGADLPTFAAEVHGLFPDALRSYAGIGRAIQAAVEQVERTPYQRESPKIGRNDPCPCGSGRKYKRCCGAAQ